MITNNTFFTFVFLNRLFLTFFKGGVTANQKALSNGLQDLTTILPKGLGFQTTTLNSHLNTLNSHQPLVPGYLTEKSATVLGLSHPF
jgi:hypothetical protein